MRSNFLIVMRMRKRFMGQDLVPVRGILQKGYKDGQCGLASHDNSRPPKMVINLRALKSCPSAVSNKMVVDM